MNKIDSETGETDYIHRHPFSVKQHVLDMETGEPLNGTEVKVRYLKQDNFQIPKKFLRATECDKINDGEYPQTEIYAKPIPVEIKSEEKCSSKQYTKEDFMNMDGVNNDILLGNTKATYLLFLIPTLFCSKMTCCFILYIIERFLHGWAHKNNVLNMNETFYFRSPLHLLTSQFCAVCRRDSEIELLRTLNKQRRKALK